MTNLLWPDQLAVSPLNKLSLLIILTAWSYQCHSQDSLIVRKDLYWLNIGSGWGGHQWAGGAGLNYKFDENKIVAFRIHATDFFGPSDGIFREGEGKNSQSYELVVGKGTFHANVKTYFTLGVGMLRIRTFKEIGSGFFGSSYDVTKKTTFGIPASGNLIINTGFIGFELELFINLNPEFFHGGGVVNVVLGDLR